MTIMPDNTHIDHDWKDEQKRIAELLLESQTADSFSSDQQTELNELLRASEDHREFAAQFLLDGEALAELLVTEEMAALASGHHSQPRVRGYGKRVRHRVFLWATAAVAGALIGVILSFVIRPEGAPDVVVADTPIAVILDQANAEFGRDAAPRDGIFEPGSYALTSGLVALQFRNGVSMTVKAPASFEIVNEFRVKVSEGQVRAFAPETGKGFTVETPKAEFEDLGTEFGVAVDAATGASEIHVFDGQVDVRNPGGTKVVASLALGDSAFVDDGEISPGKSNDPDVFPTLADIAYTRWKRTSDTIRQDPNVVFYYSFARSTENASVLRDEASRDKEIDGKIVGARWVTGRWAEKQALLFDQPGDAVEFEVPSELSQFTFAAWVNVDRFDDALTPVLNSVGWDSGDVHLQISRSRQTFSAGVHPKAEHSDTEIKLPLGRWVHLAAVVNYDEKTATTWINGKVAVQTQLLEGQTPTLGKCRLGSWYSQREQSNREFHGRMDEVILWRRALSQTEIRQLVKAGSPRPLSAID